jgi:hypothetical protein
MSAAATAKQDRRHGGDSGGNLQPAPGFGLQSWGGDRRLPPFTRVGEEFL